MAALAPAGPVYQAGTLSGNPVAVAAGLASLRAATTEVYAALDRNATRLGALIGNALTEHGVAHRVQFAGNLVSVFFTDDAGARLRRREGRRRPGASRRSSTRCWTAGCTRRRRRSRRGS